MKKTVLAIALLTGISSTAVAQSLFYQRHHGQWTVSGYPKVDKLNPNCSTTTRWKNEARLTLIHDLADGELYFAYYNPEWNIIDPPNKQGTMSIKFEDGSTWAVYNYTFEVVGPYSIRIRNLVHNQFLGLFAAATKITLQMPGSIPNVVAGMSGTRAAMGSMAECIRTAGSLGYIGGEKPGIRM